MTGKENATVIWTQSKMLCEDQINGEVVMPDCYLQASFEELLETLLGGEELQGTIQVKADKWFLDQFFFVETLPV